MWHEDLKFTFLKPSPLRTTTSLFPKDIIYVDCGGFTSGFYDYPGILIHVKKNHAYITLILLARPSR